MTGRAAVRALPAMPQHVLDRAACFGTDTNPFFPERGVSCREAKAVCRGCPVRQPCADWAITNNVHHGVWGGCSERERRKARRERGLTTHSCQRAREAS